MSLTYSEMMPIGYKAPNFKLTNVIDKKILDFDSCKGEKGTLVLFICNHCPYVVHIIEELLRVAREYEQKGVKTVAISSNDIIKYPEDSPEKMVEFALKYKFGFPYLYDETQDIARKYMAVCTPDIFLFDSDDKCYYRGRLDESSPGNGKVNDGKDLRNALEELLKGNPWPENQMPSRGCNIKWK